MDVSHLKSIRTNASQELKAPTRHIMDSGPVTCLQIIPESPLKISRGRQPNLNGTVHLEYILKLFDTQS